jgi:phosphotriesterase-related protein
MATINSVLGPLDTAELGFTLMHEHILVMNWAMRQSLPGWFDREAFLEKAVPEVRSARQLGVSTMVDLTPINLGRDIHLVREVAEKTGMQIIAATGFYWTDEPFLMGWEADRLVEFLLPDIEKGIQGTGVKAGIIKCATDARGITEYNRRLLQAAARLHRATGLPLSTHTSAAHHNGLDQQAFFREEGVDLSRVIIGHCGDSDDLGYLQEVLAAGSYIGMDRFGLDILLPTDRRLATVAELCRLGFADRMVLSHDASCQIDWFPEETLALFAPDCHYRFIPSDVLPRLRQQEVSDEQIRLMTVENPRRIFEKQGSY